MDLRILLDIIIKIIILIIFDIIIKNQIKNFNFIFFGKINKYTKMSEKDILECAKRVHGWGRIHCTDYIEPTENETKEWLLFNGIDNDVMPAYSAWNVFIKADVPALIRRGNLSLEEMHAVLKITEALMDEGPVPGLSNMDNPEVFLNDVLFRAEGNYQLSEEDLKILKDIQLSP